MKKQIIIGLLTLCHSFTNAQKVTESDMNLSARQKQMVAISAFAAKGEIDHLKTALNDGLDAGFSINESKEILIHLYAYCGFPRSLNSLTALQKVLEERKQKGIEDAVGKEASLLPVDKTSEQLGSEVLVQLVGTSEAKGVRAFAPTVDVMLKKHLFGDLFGRDVLDFQSREIVTISILSSMTGTQDQLGSHIKVALNVGLTESQLMEIVSVLSYKIGWQEGQNLQIKMNELLGLKTLQVVDNQPITDLLFPRGTRIESDHFTGKIWLEMMIKDDSVLNVSMGNVTFEPGSRTNWHSHTGGQILMVTEGVGYYQERGQTKRTIRKGEVIVCQPNTEHWHGASHDQLMSHMAVGINTQKGSVVWLESVTDEEFKQN